MKARTLSVILFTLIFFAVSHAQEEKKDRKPDFEKYNAMRIAFITDRLDLTPDEAQIFWPIFNEYQSQKDMFRMENFKISKQFMDNVEEISEAESEELLEKQMDLKKKEMEIDAEYHEKFKEVLSSKKIMKLYLSEHHFKSFLLRQIRGGERKGGQGSRDDWPDLPF